MLIFFIFQVVAAFVGIIGGLLLFIYFFIDHNNKQFKKIGLTLFIMGFVVGLLITLIEMYFV